jgi:cell division protein FtsQ
MPVRAPADKRFRRAHVHPAKRRSWMPGWRRIAAAVLVIAGVGYAVYSATALLAAHDALRVTEITVKGTNHMSPGEVQAVLQGLRGASIVTADLESWKQRLLRSPWVEDAAFRRVLPGTVSVVISERQPLGIGRVGDGLYLIDRGGTIIDEFGPSYAEFDLPIIDGLSAAGTEAGTIVDETRALLAGRLLADLQRRPQLARRISQIDVSDARAAVVVLKDDTALIRVGEDRFVERVQSYLDLAERLREEVPRIDYVDLRFDDRVYVRPQGGSPRGQKAGGR